MIRKTSAVLTLLAALTAVAAAAFAADHTDAPGTIAEPAADVNDVYAFMNPNDATELVLIASLHPIADDTSAFSDAVEYVFNVLNDADDTFEIVCTFDADENMTCEGAGETVTAPRGTTAEGTDLRAWAGLRDDPFFFDLQAFRDTVAAATPAFTDPGVNFFAGLNVLAITIGVDAGALTNDGANPVIRTWVSTRRAE